MAITPRPPPSPSRNRHHKLTTSTRNSISTTTSRNPPPTLSSTLIRADAILTASIQAGKTEAAIETRKALRTPRRRIAATPPESMAKTHPRTSATAASARPRGPKPAVEKSDGPILLLEALRRRAAALRAKQDTATTDDPYDVSDPAKLAAMKQRLQDVVDYDLSEKASNAIVLKFKCGGKRELFFRVASQTSVSDILDHCCMVWRDEDWVYFPGDLRAFCPDGERLIFSKTLEDVSWFSSLSFALGYFADFAVL